MAKKARNKNLSDKVIDAYINSDSFNFDPNGSWTGCPIDKNDKPVQDADDL